MSPIVDPWIPTLLPVERVVRETAEVVTLELDATAHPWPFTPGQFDMVWLPGHGEAAISISGDPERPTRLVHTVRAVGPTSRALTALEPGDRVGVRGPYGRGWPVDLAIGRDVVVVAGGIGLAPLRPLIYQLLAHRDRHARVVLLYGARSPADLLFVRELQRWRGRFDVDVRVIVDRAGGDWRGPVGVVTRLLDRAAFDADDAVVFTCGPEVMMRFAVRAAEEAGVPAERIFVSMERHMQCGVGLCGHCQWGDALLCRDGPVLSWDRVRGPIAVEEL